MKKTYRAEEFFEGKPLEMAKAMDANDMATFRKLAPLVDLAAPGRKSMTLLWYALQLDPPNFKAIETIIRLGVNPDEQIVQGIGSALDFALLNNDLRYLQAMLDGGLSPNHQQPKFELMLQRAMKQGGLPHVKLLVERGADVNMHTGIGRTALFTSIGTHQPEIAAYLINHGADVHATNTGGVTIAWAVHSVINRQQSGALRPQLVALRDLLISKGAKFPPDPPDVVREQMRRDGKTPAVPPGHQR